MTDTETLDAAREAYLKVMNAAEEDYHVINKEGRVDLRWVKVTRREYDALIAMHNVLFPSLEKAFRYDDHIL